MNVSDVFSTIYLMYSVQNYGVAYQNSCYINDLNFLKNTYTSLHLLGWKSIIESTKLREDIKGWALLLFLTVLDENGSFDTYASLTFDLILEPVKDIW